ncbi:MAG: putative glycoside hydrolase [Chloroflexota bacterium]|nr:putative glycoside hydrolase [Chloroflexota bacterium]
MANHFVSRFIRLFVLIGLASSLVIYVPASRASTSTWPSDYVQLAYFYKSVLNDPNLDILSTYFKSFILTKPDEKFRQDLRQKGVTAPILQYIMGTQIHDPGSCTAQPWRNQVAYKPGDYCDISQNHPDWLLRDSTGAVITYDNGGARFVQVDPGHPEWQAYFLQRVHEMQQIIDPVYGGTWGDGVFLDNIDASLGRLTRAGVTSPLYPDDASLQAATVEFLQYFKANYFAHEVEPRPIHANITMLRDESVYFDYLPYLDGTMEEGFAVDWNTGFISQTQWLTHLSRVEKTQELGKRMVVVSQVGQRGIADKTAVWQPANARQQFAYASYLLVTNGKAAFRYASASAYDYAWLYDNYTLDLGAPKGPRYQSGALWRRDFENGYVTVDPVGHIGTIALTGTGTPTPSTPPSAPSNLSATAISRQQVNLAWTDSDTETGYTIERSTTQSFSKKTSFRVDANVTTFADTTVARNTQYYYRVQAFNSSGTSAYSNTAAVKTPR